MSYSITLTNGAPADHTAVELAMDIYRDQSGKTDEYVSPSDMFLGKYMDIQFDGWELVGDGEVIAHLCVGFDQENLWRVRNFDEWEPDKYFCDILIETKGKVSKTIVNDIVNKERYSIW